MPKILLHAGGDFLRCWRITSGAVAGFARRQPRRWRASGPGSVRGLTVAVTCHAVPAVRRTRSQANDFRFGFAQALSAMILLAVVFYGVESTVYPLGGYRPW